MAIKISQLSSNNPWWKTSNWGSLDYDLKKLNFYLDRKDIEIKRKNIILLRGIRRAGKTTYLKMLVKKLEKEFGRDKILYLSCDRYTFREIKNIMNEFYLRKGEFALLLDELTYHENWNLLLKEIAETKDIIVIATGSNPIKIKEKAERLPGRGIEGNEYYFNPLNFREFVINLIKIKKHIREEVLRKNVEEIRNIERIPFKPENPKIEPLIPYYDNLEHLFYVYLLTGGLPEAIRDYVQEGKVRDETYEMTLRLLLGVLSKENKDETIGMGILNKILNLKLGRTNFEAISQEIGIHHNTVKEYLRMFESARIIYVLNSWDLSRKVLSIRKMKKIIFQNPLIFLALRKYFTGETWEGLLDFMDKNIEILVENTISTHLIWNLEIPLLREMHTFAGFYYKKYECDFVKLEKDFIGFESKYGSLKIRKYPFKTIYLSKDSINENIFPASLFLFGIEKSEKSI